MSIKAMIMAAGVGSRLDPLTSNLAKPIMPIANTPVMEHIIQNLYKHNITQIITNTWHLPETITNHFSPQILNGNKLEYIHEKTLSGTAGGVKKCEWFLKDSQPFIVMAGDALTDIDFSDLIKKHKEAKAFASVALKEVPWDQVHLYGTVVTDKENRIVDFQEKPKREDAISNMVSTCIYIFDPGVLNYIPKDQVYDFAKQVFPAMLKDKKPLYAFKTNQYWNDIGTLDQYRLSSYDVVKNSVNIEIPGTPFEKGWIGNKNKIDTSVSFEDRVIIGNENQIDKNVTIDHYTSIGNNCHIRNNTKLTGCVLLNNVRVGSNCELYKCIISSGVVISDNVKIGKNATIGNDCIIPEGTVIGENAKITTTKTL